MRHAITLLALVAALALGACASRNASPPPQPQPEPPPVKAQVATPTQRAQIRADLAAGYYERGQMGVALEELAEAQRLDPNYAKTYNVYGLVYTVMGEMQKAEESFRRALALAPQDPEIHHNWGAFLCATGRARESIPEFELAVRDRLYRTPEIALINAGKCSASIGEAAQADRFFRQALTVSPGNPVASYNLALLAYRGAHFDVARTYMRAVMQQQTPPPEALFLGMCIERKEGDRSAELSYTSQLRNRFPDSSEAKSLPGVCE